MIERILTHPGGAHKDDFLACSVLIATTGSSVERREPTAEDLADPATAVVDVGGEWESERSNFDHHQFPRESDPLCALSLVLKHLGLYEDAQAFCEWLETAEWFDTRGPFETGQMLGVPREAVGKLNSPLDITLLRRFARSTSHAPGEPIWEVMRMIGDDLLEYLKSTRDRLDFIDAHSQLWEIGSGLKALFLPRTEPLPEEPSAAIGRFVELRGLAEQVIAQVYPDRRGEGYGMSRLSDDKRMEFTRIRDEPDVHFAHARGFIAKTSATDLDRLGELLGKALKK